MKVEDDVEASSTQLAAQPRSNPERREKATATKSIREYITRKEEDLVDSGLRLDGSGGGRLDEPGHVGLGIVLTERSERGERSDDVAQGAESNDQNAVSRGRFRERIDTADDDEPRRGTIHPLGYLGMRVPRTLYRYLAREILQYGGLTFIGTATILLSQHLLRRLDDLIAVGFDRDDFWTLLQALLPMLTTYSVPVAFLLGVTLAVSRLVGDSEVLAMRASGIGLRALLLPTLVLGSGVSMLTAYLVLSVEPAAQRELRTLFKVVAARGAILEAGKFRDVLGRLFFVDRRIGKDRLEGIVISDRSDPARPFLVFAESGRMFFDEESSTIRLQLERGDLHLEPEAMHPDRYRRIAFREFEYRLDISNLVSGKATLIRPREMGLGELYDTWLRLRSGETLPHLREPNPIVYEIQLHRRFALPVAPLLFGWIAVPLSLRLSRNTRLWGVALSTLLALVYYSLLSLGQFLAHRAWLDPAVAMWAPSGALLAVALLLLRRDR